ncbi:MAG TPA: DUF3568 family protein [Longimicrobiaceae bacterium]|jgi:hypothetical protein|nr:DUF3568 family protein [Longimicrobiaceae bacterium]
MNQTAQLRRLSLLLLLVSSVAACVAVAAGAGAAAAIAWTERGAKSQVEGTPDQLYSRSASVFQEMGIQQTGQSSGQEGGKRTLTGSRGDLDVTVEITTRTPTTSDVEVYARKSAVEWDKNFARDVLTRIIKRS